MELKEYISKLNYIVEEVFEGYQTAKGGLKNIKELNEKRGENVIEVTEEELEDIYDTNYDSSFEDSSY